MNLWLIQYLCPSRHAIAAAPYNRDLETEAAIEGTLLAMLYQGGINPWCGLCGSRELHFEHGQLAFTDWDTAIAALKACEADQRLTRDLVATIRQDQN